MRENRSAIVDTIISAIANIAIATINFNNTHSHARNHVSCDHRINVIFAQRGEQLGQRHAAALLSSENCAGLLSQQSVSDGASSLRHTSYTFVTRHKYFAISQIICVTRHAVTILCTSHTTHPSQRRQVAMCASLQHKEEAA
jgi:hypothetical protein